LGREEPTRGADW